MVACTFFFRDILPANEIPTVRFRQHIYLLVRCFIKSGYGNIEDLLRAGFRFAITLTMISNPEDPNGKRQALLFSDNNRMIQYVNQLLVCNLDEFGCRGCRAKEEGKYKNQE